MFRIVIVLIAAAWLILHSPFAAAADSVKVGTKVGERMPDFRLKDLEGRQVSLGDFRGRQAVLLAFGAGW